MNDSVPLSGRRVAMLVEDEFEDRALIGPLDTLRVAGATIDVPRRSSARWPKAPQTVIGQRRASSRRPSMSLLTKRRRRRLVVRPATP
jgi:hypothetical protein